MYLCNYVKIENGNFDFVIINKVFIINFFKNVFIYVFKKDGILFNCLKKVLLKRKFKNFLYIFYF